MSMSISVVIPTCNRKQGLLALLKDLDRSAYPVAEVIIVDSGEDRLVPEDYAPFRHFPVQYLNSEKSVCIQRNIGIRQAISPWIFLCDDDIEIPADYLQKLMEHISGYPESGAVSGIVLQKEKNEWKGKYPLRSPGELLWKFIFQLSIWGEIDCSGKGPLFRRIKSYYQQKGNHISKAGWPVITDFSGDYFVSPVYGLGASLVKKEWLLISPYDEVLDRHGIGDNYGVALGFPVPGIHVLNNTWVYHHQEPVNRLHRPLQYFRRALALDYFIKTKQGPYPVKKRWLVWSLAGNFLESVLAGDTTILKASLHSIRSIAFGRNPYYEAAKNKKRVIEPAL